MKYTFIGRTGRAQLTVFDSSEGLNRARFRVRLLPRGAKRSTSYATAGDQAYLGPDLEMALIHIRAWTGLTDFMLPAALQAHMPESAQDTGDRQLAPAP